MAMSIDAEHEIISIYNDDISYARFQVAPKNVDDASIVLSSCSGSDDENDSCKQYDRDMPPLKWKRQKIVNTPRFNTDNRGEDNDAGKSLPMNRLFLSSCKENIAVSIDDERSTIAPRRLPPIPEDKLHRRNPRTVRQEIQLLDDLIPEANLADVNLSEMPGLQNTEQWKRIAGRTAQNSPPLPRQYYQGISSSLDLQQDAIRQPLGSYRRPGRSDDETILPQESRIGWRLVHRRILTGSSIVVVVFAITTAVLLAVLLSRKNDRTVTDFYQGIIHINARFDASLSNPSSTLSRSYRKTLCSMIGTVIVDSSTKYAQHFSTCSVTRFRNGSIIADFVLGFSQAQDATRLSSFLNRTLYNQSLFDGTILSIALNSAITNISNNTSPIDNESNDEDVSYEPGKITEMEQNSTHEPAQPCRTTYTTVTYTTLDKGVSITISETITITNNTNNTNTDSIPINSKNYEVILLPTIDNTKTIVVPPGATSDKMALPNPITTTITSRSASQQNLVRPVKPLGDANFAYIDESSDERTISSVDVVSTMEEGTAREDSVSSASTGSMDDGTLTNSASTLTNNPGQLTSKSPIKQTTMDPASNTWANSGSKIKVDISEEKRPVPPVRLTVNPMLKRQRRLIQGKNPRRLLQYELMPTGKVYYVDRPMSYHQRNQKSTEEENSSTALSTIISRSSSLDTLSEKRYRYRSEAKNVTDSSTLKNPEKKLLIGGRLASNQNLTSGQTSSPFKPINNQKKRFSSFEPTPESLDRVFDVLIAADKRREEHEFWKEKFDHRPTNSRATLPPIPSSGRNADSTNTNTIPILRSRAVPSGSNMNVNHPNDYRSQSFTTPRITFNEQIQRPGGTTFADSTFRRRAHLAPQQIQRNYSPNTIYSTIYPKQQVNPNAKPPLPTSTNNPSHVRILPTSNGRLGRAPQARQTSDELSSVSDVWATRSSMEDERSQGKKSSFHPRFPSAHHRARFEERKEPNTKRASSVEQQKNSRSQSKTQTSKSKFFDLFKFNR